jgi:hypothetical protein
MKNKFPIKGQRFGRLTIIGEMTRGKSNKPYFLCRCDCDIEKSILWASLRKGATQSCGCFRNERIKATSQTHGLKSAKYPHKLYQAWRGIKTRCFNPKNAAFKNYGAKGITIAPEWKDDPIAFVQWALANGWTPNLTIDRIDRRGNYEPSNIEFISKSENSRRRNQDDRSDRRAMFAVSQLSLPV